MRGQDVIPRFRAIVNMTSKAEFAINGLVRVKVCSRIVTRACKIRYMISSMVTSKRSRSWKGSSENTLIFRNDYGSGVLSSMYDLEGHVDSGHVVSSGDGDEPEWQKALEIHSDHPE